MFISQNWLKDFVKLPAKISATEIAEKLTAHTVEVEGFINQADKYNKVVVGKVLQVEKHPNADRLRVALVDVKTEKLQIVCGAPNLAVSQLVPVALVGAHLPNGLEIKESQIRGETSFGMICAEDELGLGDDHEGIMVLKSRAKIGQSFADYLKVNDIVFEIDNKSLSNRPDLLGHYGLARELAVIFSSPLKPYDKFYSTKIDFPAKTNKLTIEVEAKELAPKYLAVKISNFKVEDSPSWLQERLIAVGQRPINNIVDLTNYVMLECGQPLHAFEADKLKKISVRLARKNETIVTLDGKERILNENDLVIADSNQAIAIAGVMGGYLILFPGARVIVMLIFGFFVTFVRVKAVLVLGIWILLQVVSGLTSLGMSSRGGVAWFAHIGGFLLGVLWCKIVSNRYYRTHYW